MMKLDKTISNALLKQKKGGEVILGDCIYFDNNEGIILDYILEIIKWFILFQLMEKE